MVIPAIKVILTLMVFPGGNLFVGALVHYTCNSDGRNNLRRLIAGIGADDNLGNKEKLPAFCGAGIKSKENYFDRK